MEENLCRETGFILSAMQVVLSGSLPLAQSSGYLFWCLLVPSAFLQLDFLQFSGRDLELYYRLSLLLSAIDFELIHG